ncbi:hypothetical protein LUW77_10690 [Streptomyces radiopugnans]|nr:hypothetical protein LUW77_10690 [Streptomyces radiopugnans]
MFAARYPRHPDFDPRGSRKAITPRDLRTALEWIGRAMEDGSRRVVVDSHHLQTVRRIVHPLGLGEVHDGPLTVANDWRLRINKKAAESPETGRDLAVETIRGWLAELGYEGLDRNVANLVIAVYALLDDRTWIYQTTPLPQAPELERIGPGYGLRAVALPGEETFAAALRRAGTVFGQSASPVLFARNVARLASRVREVAEEHRTALAEARALLQTQAARLGLDGPGGADAPRMRSMKAAADLVARLLRTDDPTLFTEELAGAAYEVGDEEIGAALKHAPEVLEALRATDWTLLDTLRELAERGDGVGERARGQLDAVVRAAGSHERDESLVPALGGLHGSVMALMREATRLAQAAPPVTPPDARPPAPARPDADDVRLTEHGTPPVPGTPVPAAPATPGVPAEPARPGADGGPARQREGSGTESGSGRAYLIEPTRLETGLADTLADLGAEIRGFLTAHPGSRVRVSWQAVEPGTGETGDGTGAAGAEH